MAEPSRDDIRGALAEAIANEVPDQYARLATDAALAVLDDAATERYVQQQLAETGIRSIDFRNGMNMELQPARDLAAGWVAAARTMLGAAENYSETPVDLPKVEMEVGLAGEYERYVFVCQRAGKLTPHQARRRAEAERDALAAELDASRHEHQPTGELVGPDRIPACGWQQGPPLWPEAMTCGWEPDAPVHRTARVVLAELAGEERS